MNEITFVKESKSLLYVQLDEKTTKKWHYLELEQPYVIIKLLIPLSIRRKTNSIHLNFRVFIN